jgi:hypothetical protein
MLFIRVPVEKLNTENSLSEAGIDLRGRLKSRIVSKKAHTV